MRTSNEHPRNPQGESLPDASWRVALPGLAESVPVLRNWVRLVLAEAPEAVDALELVASEYGTNALWHSASGAPGGRITAEVTVTPEVAHLTVWDDGKMLNGMARDCPTDHGRGLMLVSACADAHGDHDGPDGHQAWAVIQR